MFINYILAMVLLSFALLMTITVFLAYVFALTHVVMFGRVKERRARFIAFPILIVIIAYGVTFYDAILSAIVFDISLESPWQKMLFITHFPWILVAEGIVLLFTHWFRIGCSLDALKFRPTSDQVENFTDKYELMENGHRDIVMLIVLSGDEEVNEVKHCLTSIAQSKFPLRRLRVLLSFPSTNILPLDHDLRVNQPIESSHINAELSTTQNITFNGLRITFCRFGATTKSDADKAMFSFLAEEYHLKQRKPYLLFMSAHMTLSDSAIASLAYEMDNPMRLAVTGLEKSPNVVALNTLSRTVLDTMAEDYSGNATVLPEHFRMIRFKVFKKVHKHFFPVNEDEKDTFEWARSELSSERFLAYLVSARRNRHRVGVCLNAHFTLNRIETNLIGTRRNEFLSTTANGVHRIVSLRTWKNVPLINLLELERIIESHLWVWISLLLVDFLIGNGSTLGFVYILLLIVPDAILVVTKAYYQGHRFSILMYPLTQLIMLFVDVVAILAAFTYAASYRLALLSPVHSALSNNAMNRSQSIEKENNSV